MIAAEHILMLLNSADAITPGARAFFRVQVEGTEHTVLASLTGACSMACVLGHSGHRLAAEWIWR
jgi:hypothetical protein